MGSKTAEKSSIYMDLVKTRFKTRFTKINCCHISHRADGAGGKEEFDSVDGLVVPFPCILIMNFFCVGFGRIEKLNFCKTCHYNFKITKNVKFLFQAKQA
jgi:hypothetical protein